MLVDRLTNYFHPKSSIVAEPYKFVCHRQGDSEGLASRWIALDENLYDRFVCGLTQEYIQSRLLTETDDLSFDRAVEIATRLQS